MIAASIVEAMDCILSDDARPGPGIAAPARQSKIPGETVKQRALCRPL
jgi:hypothetical protein